MKFRKITALLLVLCMMLSLSISAFAANNTVASGTIPDSKIKWELDSHGWLTISGSGEAPVFTSADDQPWAEYRDQITEVWYDDMEALVIPDLAYWFEGCPNLTTAELPLVPSIGKHAFYNCPKLTTITMYYGETVLESIGENAFWRETDGGDTLTIYYILGYPDATVPFHDYDWNNSNRPSRLFEDVYGLETLASVVGNCPSCGQYSLQATYVSQTHTSRGHQEYAECYKCHYSWSSKQHYFNRIDGIDIDLTSQERIDNPFNKYSECSRKGLPPKNETRILEKASTLLREAKISERGESNVS